MATVAESTNIKSLRRQRAVIKAQVTRLITYLNENPEAPITTLENRQSKLEQFFNSFLEVQLALEIEDEETDYTTDREHFEKQYYTTAVLISERLRRLREPPRPAPTSRRAEPPNSSIRQVSTLLPKIELKPFDGNPIEWHSFHDTFGSLVHDNEDLIGVQKFHLLKNALRGEAAAVIASLNASEGNYQVAWDLLKNRCNKPRQAINAHLKLLLEFPEITRDTPASLRHLSEQAQMHINALRAMNQPIQHWDMILVHIVSRKLDRNTRRAWERTLEDQEIPHFEQLLEFINQRARGDDFDVEFFRPFKENKFESNLRAKQPRGQAYVSTSRTNRGCVVCKGEHYIYSCNRFLDLAIRDRLDTVKGLKLCINCLRSTHSVGDCKLGNCRKCEKRHHTLLHFSTDRQEFSGNNHSSTNPSASPENIRTSLTISCDSEVLLRTAQIVILDKHNHELVCRVLLDGGSQSQFITDRLAERLQLQKHRIDLSFSGLGQLSTNAKYFVKTNIMSCNSDFESRVTFIALPSITGLLPLRKINRNALNIPNHIRLADPNFHEPNEIDGLLGNTLFYSLLNSGQIRVHKDSIILQNTRLGWIVTGESNIDQRLKNNAIRVCHLATSLDNQISQFWTIEEMPERRLLSAEETECEKHFTENTTRNEGRYTVRLPFNERKNLLAEFRSVAVKRFYSLERKLQGNPELHKQYSQFLKEYLELGHMREISDDRDRVGYYLPHHAVVKDSSSTTKVRVVFDASAKTSSGNSLNDALLIGPTIQDTLFSIILRFRIHAYVLTADIEKMFRQIRIHEDDREFQKIVWRDSIEKPIKTYALNTVTYGTASAPFLAVRCLKQLALDQARRFPLAARAFEDDFYVDDLLTGASSFESALELRNDLIELGKLGGFHLRQWTSNDTRLLADLQGKK